MKFFIWFRDVRQERYLAGWQRAVDIRRVHSRANAILGFDRQRQRRVAPCPDCSLPTLYSYAGENVVACSDEECGMVMSLRIAPRAHGAKMSHAAS